MNKQIINFYQLDNRIFFLYKIDNKGVNIYVYHFSI